MTEYILNPTSVKMPDGTDLETPTPLAWAMENAELGSVVTLTPGRYLPWDGAYLKQKKLRPSLVRAVPGAESGSTTVAPKEGASSCFYIVNPELHGDIAFHGLRFETGTECIGIWLINAASHYGYADIPFRPISFVDCEFDGGWDYANDVATFVGAENVKWGLRIHRSGELTIVDCEFHGFRFEHAIYASQIHGTTLIQDNTIWDCGRTGIQITNRIDNNGGLPGYGLLRIRRNDIRRTGQADGGGGITVSGMSNTVFIEENTVRDCESALVIWPEYGPGDPLKPGNVNGDVVLYGNTFEGAEKGLRDVAQISACERLYLEKNSFIAKVPTRQALAINPIGKGLAGMGSTFFPVHQVLPKVGEILKTNDFVGKVTYWGNEVKVTPGAEEGGGGE